MQNKRSQEYQKLLDSVREYFNRDDGLDRRRKEAKYSLGIL